MVTAERIDPILVEGGSAYDRQALRLHLERYEFASRIVDGKRVVDCACGTGYGAEMMARSGASTVIGVDLDPGAIEYAETNHRHPSVSYVAADALEYKPVFAPDVWVSFETIEHLPEPARYLTRVYENLAEGGLLIASVPTTVSTDGNPYHLTDFTRRSWRRLLSSTGFSVESEHLQEHRYSLSDIFGSSRGERQKQVRAGVFRYYVSHPKVALARAALTMTRGLVHEYSTVVARRTSSAGKAASRPTDP